MKERCARQRAKRPRRSFGCSRIDAGPGSGPRIDEVARARAFAEPLLAGRELPTGESALAHGDGVAAILAFDRRGAGAPLGGLPRPRRRRPRRPCGDRLGLRRSQAELVAHARSSATCSARRRARARRCRRAQQVERVRKMLLAFSRDLRVVLLRLASRLQTLRWFAASKRPVRPIWRESMQVFAPLANRLGIWQIKWELEDLASASSTPRRTAPSPPSRRAPRRPRGARRGHARQPGRRPLHHGLAVEVHGRPKHLYSIWKKMRRKGLGFDRVLDVIALRVIVADVAACYAVLGRVHERFEAIPGELDDYIARPKPNGYRSLHTVVQDDDGGAVEIQIRTAAMHEHAEYGVSAHWAYKEAATTASVAAAGAFEAGVAQARLVVLRQLLAWERDLAGEDDDELAALRQACRRVRPSVFDERIYVFTPQATLVELAAGATPIDFAYAVHTELGHRCRGARVDGAMVPLNTPLRNGQTVEVTAIKTGGPSLDWLNPELGYLRSPRSKAKVRAWFNAQATDATIARGREPVEKLLQREGKTSLKQDELATQLGFRSADALFEVVGKDELSLRSIEALLRPAARQPDRRVASEDRARGRRGRRSRRRRRLAVDEPRPVLPAGAAGRHRRLRHPRQGRGGASRRLQQPARARRARRERVIPVEWGGAATSRPGPLSGRPQRRGERPARAAPRCLRGPRQGEDQRHRRQVESVRDSGCDTAFMTFTIEVADATRARRSGWSAGSPACGRHGVADAARAGRRQRTGIGVARSTGTALTLFCGEPSTTRSE